MFEELTPEEFLLDDDEMGDVDNKPTGEEDEDDMDDDSAPKPFEEEEEL